MLHFLSHQQIDSIIEHAKEEYPNECCGIIAGNEKRVECIIRVKNELCSTVSFSINPKELKTVLEKLDESGLEFIGIYHSHPKSAAYPSDIDKEKSIFPEVDHLIISLADQDNPKISNFKIDGDEVLEEPYVVFD